MKSAFCYLALVSTATIVAAASCTSDVALPWSAVTGGGGSDDTCNGDAICEGLVAEGQCNSLSLIDDEDTTCAQKLKMLKRTVDLSCTGVEKCVAFLDDSLLCLDETTGNYHDDVGGNGNAISGVYTAPDGKVQTVTGVSADPTSTATATATATPDDDRPPGASAARTVTSEAASATASVRSSTASIASSQSSAASQQSQSSSVSQSASAAQQTGAAVQQVVGGLEMLAVAAVPIVMAAL